MDGDVYHVGAGNAISYMFVGHTNAEQWISGAQELKSKIKADMVPTLDTFLMDLVGLR